MRLLIILLCFVVPPLVEIDQLVASKLISTPIFPEWFSWIDIFGRGLIILKTSSEMVQFNKYWKNLMDTMKLAEQFEEIKRQAEILDNKSPANQDKPLVKINHDVDFLWD